MEYVLRQLQTRCVLCKATENLTVDHVQPVSKGYNLYPGNAVVLCLSCNSRKGNKNLQELPLKTSYKLANAAYEFFVKWKIKESKERNVSYA
jgi:5-methylcytosine-specific restriction endonuclease McrA